MDPVYTYFSENLDTVSKQEILVALKNALLSAGYWREVALGLKETQATNATVAQKELEAPKLLQE